MQLLAPEFPISIRLLGLRVSSFQTSSPTSQRKLSTFIKTPTNILPIVAKESVVEARVHTSTRGTVEMCPGAHVNKSPDHKSQVHAACDLDAGRAVDIEICSPHKRSCESERASLAARDTFEVDTERGSWNSRSTPSRVTSAACKIADDWRLGSIPTCDADHRRADAASCSAKDTYGGVPEFIATNGHTCAATSNDEDILVTDPSYYSIRTCTGATAHSAVHTCLDVLDSNAGDTRAGAATRDTMSEHVALSENCATALDCPCPNREQHSFAAPANVGFTQVKDRKPVAHLPTVLAVRHANSFNVCANAQSTHQCRGVTCQADDFAPDGHWPPVTDHCEQAPVEVGKLASLLPQIPIGRFECCGPMALVQVAASPCTAASCGSTDAKNVRFVGSDLCLQGEACGLSASEHTRAQECGNVVSNDCPMNAVDMMDDAGLDDDCVQLCTKRVCSHCKEKVDAHHWQQHMDWHLAIKVSFEMNGPGKMVGVRTHKSTLQVAGQQTGKQKTRSLLGKRFVSGFADQCPSTTQEYCSGDKQRRTTSGVPSSLESFGFFKVKQ